MFVRFQRWRTRYGHAAFTGVPPAAPTWRETLAILGTQSFVLVSWVFFRAESLTQTGTYLTRCITHPWLGLDYSLYATGLCLGLLIFEWLQRTKVFTLDLRSWPLMFRSAAYAGLLLLLIELGSKSDMPFIYFQF